MKCRVLVDRCSPTEIEELRREGFQIDTGCTRVLGCPVGTPDASQNWVMNKVSSWGPFWERLRHSALHPLTALTILSKCGNVKFEHLARALPFNVVADAARQFDEIVSDTARVILGIPRDTVEDYVLRIVLHLKPYVVVSPVLYQTTVKAFNRIKVNIGQEQLNAISEHYKLISLPPFVGQLMVSAQGRTAADTIRITCGSTESGYSAHEIAQGLRLRCGIMPRHVPHTCTCGYIFGDIPSPIPTNAHLLTCPHNTVENKTTRHHAVANALIRVMSTYRITTIFNQWRLDPLRLLIPDMHVLSLRPRQALTDLTIVDDVVQNDHALLDIAAAEKHQKYDDFAERLRMSFWALPVSTYGRLHHETERFLELIAHAIPSSRRRDFRQEARTAIQLALLVGNSRTVDQALERLSGVGSNWFRQDR